MSRDGYQRGRGRDSDEGENEPWNVFELRERPKMKDGKPTGETDTRWVLCGTGWAFREGTGFSIDLDWDIKKGSRLQLMPRKK